LEARQAAIQLYEGTADLLVELVGMQLAAHVLVVLAAARMPLSICEKRLRRSLYIWSP